MLRGAAFREGAAFLGMNCSVINRSMLECFGSRLEFHLP